MGIRWRWLVALSLWVGVVGIGCAPRVAVEVDLE